MSGLLDTDILSEFSNPRPNERLLSPGESVGGLNRKRIGTEIYSHLLKGSGAQGEFHGMDTIIPRIRQTLLETFLSTALNQKSPHP